MRAFRGRFTDTPHRTNRHQPACGGAELLRTGTASRSGIERTPESNSSSSSVLLRGMPGTDTRIRCPAPDRKLSLNAECPSLPVIGGDFRKFALLPHQEAGGKSPGPRFNSRRRRSATSQYPSTAASMSTVFPESDRPPLAPEPVPGLVSDGSTGGAGAAARPARHLEPFGVAGRDGSGKRS
jgi:hypothetical protein